MDVYKIEKIVRKGGSSLAEPLHKYWPVLSNTDDMSERNTTLHLGHELIKAGFSVYAEHPFEMKGEPEPEPEPEPELVSLDLLALNYKEKTQIRIKVKVDFDKDGIYQDLADLDNKTINLIYQDLKEIKSFQLDPNDEYNYKHYFNNEFGIIICTSWDSNFIKWWEKPFETESTENLDTPEKEKIGLLIERSNEGTGDCASGTYPLENSEVNRGDDAEYWPIHGMQYLIFDLKSKGIKKLLP